MSTADKLNKLLKTKQAIKQAIIDKGVDVNDNTVFADYPNKIAAIESGGGNPYYEDLHMQRTNDGANMKGLFYYCNSPELDLSRLDTSKVTDMSYMFGYCSSQINIDGWDTSEVTNASYMLQSFTGSIDLTKLDFSSVTNVSNMFNYANLDNIILTGLKFPSATSYDNMFNNAKATTLDLSSWDISHVKNMNSMFQSSGAQKIDLTGWKTTNVTNMSTMFNYVSNLIELIIPDWDMTNVTSSNNFFNSSSSSTKALMLIDLSRSNDTTITKIASYLPTRTTTTFGEVIIPADSSQASIDALIAKYWKPVGPRIDIISCEVTPELDEVKPGKSTKLYAGNCEPWYGDNGLEAIEFISSNESVATIDGDIVTATGVEGTTEITVRNINTQEVISEPKVFSVSETDSYPNVIKLKGTNAPTSSNYIYVNGTSSSNKVLLSAMNYNPASGIYTYDVGAPITSIVFDGYGSANYANTCTEVVKFNTSNIISMERMFQFTNITSLNVSDWDTSNIANMGYIFNNCDLLTELDLSNWDTGKVTTMAYMFNSCDLLTSLDIRNFDTSKVSNISSMFNGCNKLHTLRLDNCNNNTISKIIKSGNFPTSVIEGVTRKIYCKEENAAGLTPPTNWVFEYIE